jgi:hypothetical protein
VRRVYSFSKRTTLDRCLRQYFYEYYVCEGHVPDERSNRILGLKKMTNASLLAGDLLHRFIRLSFTKPHLSAQWSHQTALKSFDDAVQFARNPRGQAERLNDKYPPKELVEFSYDDLAGEEAAEREREKLDTALGNFFRGGQVRAYLQSLEGYTLMPEKRLSGLKESGWAISGQIDLLAVNGRGCEVADWKLGAQERGSDSLQLHIYGTFAASLADVRPEDVHMRRVFLSDGVVELPRSMDKETAYIGRTRLLQDIDLMNELHEYGERGREGVFTPCNQENVCQRCKYRATCHEVPLKASSLQT